MPPKTLRVVGFRVPGDCTDTSLNHIQRTVAEMPLLVLEMGDGSLHEIRVNRATLKQVQNLMAPGMAVTLLKVVGAYTSFLPAGEAPARFDREEPV